MLRFLMAFPVLGGLLMLQLGVAGRMPLINGTVDLMLIGLAAWASFDRVKNAWLWTLIGGLMVSYFTAMPFYALMISYFGMTLFARYFQRRVWQTPLLALLVTVLVGSILEHSISIVALFVSGTSFSFMSAIQNIAIPSILLNLLISLPVYALMSDLARWLYPVEVV